MKNRIVIHASVVAIVLLTVLALPSTTLAQLPGTKRTNLQQKDISVPGREIVQARIDIEEGVLAPRHSHPGEEIIYVIEGKFEYKIDGQPPVILKAGDVLFIPAGAVHSARNIGKGTAAELATYIVEKGKPLLQVAN